jgi:hypothetical protein
MRNQIVTDSDDRVGRWGEQSATQAALATQAARGPGGSADGTFETGQWAPRTACFGDGPADTTDSAFGTG